MKHSYSNKVGIITLAVILLTFDLMNLMRLPCTNQLLYVDPDNKRVQRVVVYV